MPLIPKEVVDRIARGENALRALRQWRGKTQLYIAHKTNIGQGYISDLERGLKLPLVIRSHRMTAAQYTVRRPAQACLLRLALFCKAATSVNRI
jgi:transcriptional regulator with XRE-family HTH domain